MSETGQVAEINQLREGESQLASEIANMWHDLNQNRQGWIEQKKELRDYIFATDTSTTSNASLPWKNKTTLPKLCQIRDNLHANYMQALFPNDNWLRWEPHDIDSSKKEVAKAIEAYMRNKLRVSGFKDTVSKLVYDYIDYGNCFADVNYKKIFKDNDQEKEVVKQYPYAIRRSPFEVTFNLSANSVEDSYQVFRIIKTMGELEQDILEKPGATWQIEALQKMKDMRTQLADYSAEDINKAYGVEVDGFGSYAEYLQSNYIEIFEFRGSIYDRDSETFLNNHKIVVIDRSFVIEKGPIDNWTGRSTLVHGGWRYRPDNLYAMGPLDNLVGMQYRIDHLENIKADLFDLIAHPPLKIKGMVEEFDWEPMAQIYMDDNGDVETLKVDATALQADTQIAILQQQMDEFAGAPKQAIGARTPGEKTAFEVQTLEQNASKMFQEKVVQFEEKVLEPLVNAMLEIAKRQLDGADLVGVMDDDLGVQEFLNLSKQDITSNGNVRPIGARHFAQRAQLVQNYQGMRNIFQQDPGVMNHISGLAEAMMFEDSLGLDRFDLVRKDVRIAEQIESQRMVQEGSAALQEEQLTPADDIEAEAFAEAPPELPPEEQQ